MAVTKLFHYGPWNAPYKSSAFCADGKVRFFKTAQSADTFFSIPANGKILGISVRGFITPRDDGEYEFVCLPSKNFDKLPDIFKQRHLSAKEKMETK